MKRNRKKIWILIGVLIIVLVFPPLLDSVIHDNDSPRSAIRAYIRDDGYPYQSFFAIIISRDIYDEDYGHKYEVIWHDWKNETGMTGTICYAKQNENEKYSVSCGTGP